MTFELSDFAAQLRIQMRASASGASEDSLDESKFNVAALKLFRLQFELNAPYRRLCETRKAFPASVSHWTQVPAVPTSAFKDFEFSCLPSGVRTRVFHSSGTTAQKPSRHFHSQESIALYEDSAMAWFRSRVIANLESQPENFAWAMLTPPPDQAPHSSLVHMLETIRLAIGAPKSSFLGHAAAGGSWDLRSTDALSVLTESIRDRRPVIVLGTAFLFVHLLDLMASRSLRLSLPAGSRVFETGGYKGRSRAVPKTELLELLDSHLAIPDSRVHSEYGMSELSSQAYNVRMRIAECGLPNKRSEKPGSERVFQFPPWSRWQVVSPDDGREVAVGETGLLRVFDLANVFSVMAVQTEDLAVRRENGFELIGRAESAELRGCSLMTEPSLSVPQSAI